MNWSETVHRGCVGAALR